MLPWIVGLIALVLGLLIGFLFRNASAGAQVAAARAEKAPLEHRNAELVADRDAVRSELDKHNAEILRLTAENSKLEADLANEKGNGARLTQQFRLLAVEILKENSRTFSDDSQKEIGNCYSPTRACGLTCAPCKRP